MSVAPGIQKKPDNLAAPLNWVQLLAALGVDEVDGLLPRRVRCPQCQTVSLDVFQDTTNGGTWHHCVGCQLLGDGIEMAAAVWGCSLSEAHAHLSRAGLLSDAAADVVTAYATWYVERRLKNAALWSKAQTQLFRMPTLRSIRHWIGAEGGTSDLWPQRGGAYIGALSGPDTSQLITPRTPGNLQLRDRWLKHQHLLPDFLVIPVSDMPGRLSGALLAYGNGDPKERCCLGVTSLRTTSDFCAYPPTGVAMLDVLADTADTSPVLVMFDLLLAARLHVRHFADDSRPLPIVAVCPAAPTAPILRQLLPGRRIIVCSPQVDTDLLRHAYALNADIATGQSTEEIVKTISRVSPATWLDQVSLLARDRAEILETKLQTSAPVEIESIFRSIGFSTDERRRFVVACPAALRDRLSRVSPDDPTRVVQVGPRRIVEKSTGWWDADTGQLLTATPFYIDEILTTTSQPSRYLGRIRFQGRDIPFLATGGNFSEQPLRWAVRFLRKQGYQLNRAHHLKHAMEISTSFHPPKTIVDQDPRTPAELAGDVLKLVAQRYLGGDFTLAWPDTATDHPALIYRPDRKKLWIPSAILRQVAASAGSKPFRVEQLVNLVWFRPAVFHGQPGWLVPETRWNNTVAAARAAARPKLKIHSA